MNLDQLDGFIFGFDVVVNCLFGRIGYVVRVLLLFIEGIFVVDLVFIVEDFWNYDELVKEYGSRMIYDVGIVFGLFNVLLMVV